MHTVCIIELALLLKKFKNILHHLINTEQRLKSRPILPVNEVNLVVSEELALLQPSRLHGLPLILGIEVGRSWSCKIVELSHVAETRNSWSITCGVRCSRCNLDVKGLIR